MLTQASNLSNKKYFLGTAKRSSGPTRVLNIITGYSLKRSENADYRGVKLDANSSRPDMDYAFKADLCVDFFAPTVMK